MENHPQLLLTAAFLTGVLFTLKFKDFYLALDHLSCGGRTSERSANGDGDESGLFDETLRLEDETIDQYAFQSSAGIVEGIEGTIGNTPLIRIKSLSDATGCEILGKAEESDIKKFSLLMISFDYSTVSQWCWRKPERPSGFEHHKSCSRDPVHHASILANIL